jgi:hypothetical protein
MSRHHTSYTEAGVALWRPLKSAYYGGRATTCIDAR